VHEERRGAGGILNWEPLQRKRSARSSIQLPQEHSNAESEAAQVKKIRCHEWKIEKYASIPMNMVSAKDRLPHEHDWEADNRGYKAVQKRAAGIIVGECNNQQTADDK